ncbi:MAG: hypothetical protein J07HX64_02406 [halophilic archaeon J07HX64]|nr:MAG: hypothetical protein J07HX64_02406 [halophilic archaeon J07HX64]
MTQLMYCDHGQKRVPVHSLTDKPRCHYSLGVAVGVTGPVTGGPPFRSTR